jgi:quercetin dioxygenase-like cupin family protein
MLKKVLSAILASTVVIVGATASGSAGPLEKQTPMPRIIKLDLTGKDYQRVLGGPPESSTMRSGLVVLAPGASVGKHNTDNYEEMIVVFEGRAEIRVTGQPALRIEQGFVAYCPSHTEHDVFNVGDEPLRYLYIVALGRESKPADIHD